MSIEDVNTKVAQAIAAAEGGDYGTAVQKLRSAKALLSVMPDVETPDRTLRWDRSAIDNLINGYQQQQAAAAGIQRTKIRYRNPRLGYDHDR